MKEVAIILHDFEAAAARTAGASTGFQFSPYVTGLSSVLGHLVPALRRDKVMYQATDRRQPFSSRHPSAHTKPPPCPPRPPGRYS